MRYKTINGFTLWIAVGLVLLLSQYSQAQVKMLDLSSAMKIALSENADIRVEALENRVQSREHWQAVAEWLPLVNGEAGYIETSGRNGMPDFVGANGLRERIAYLGVQQNLFDAGSWMNLRESGIARRQQAVVYSQTKQSILFEVISTYFEGLKTQGEIKTFEENLKAFQLIYQQSQLLFRNGEVPEIDVKKSQVEFMLQKNSLVKARKSYQETLDYMKQLLNLSMDQEIDLQAFIKKPIHLDSLDYYYKIALSNNPSLKIMKMELSRYSIRKTAALLQHLPSASAGFLYGWDANDPFRQNNRGWQVYVNISLPLWHWGALLANRQIVGYHYRQTQTGIGQLEKQIFRQVSSAHNDCIVQQQQMKAMEESLEAATQAAQMARIGYREGTLTNLDLINTQKLLTETNINYTNALYDFYIAKARLSLTIGEMKENFEWIEN